AATPRPATNRNADRPPARTPARPRAGLAGPHRAPRSRCRGEPRSGRKIRPSGSLARDELAVLVGKAANQAIDPAARGLLVELGAVGFDQPDAEHVDVVDLPGASEFLQPVVELDRLAAWLHDLAAHDDIGGVVGRTQRPHPDLLVVDRRERA